MTKEQLLAMGFTEEQASKIIEAHKAEIKDKFVPIERLNEKISELKTQTDLVKERDQQIGDLKKFEGDKTALETKISELEKQNKETVDKYAADFKTERTMNAIKLAILNQEHQPQEGAMDLVVGSIDPSRVELGEDGSIKGGFKEQFENAVKERAFLFNKAEKAPDNKTDFNWAPKGTKPAEGTDDKKEVKTAEQFGAHLAGVKLAQSGIKPKESAAV